MKIKSHFLALCLMTIMAGSQALCAQDEEKDKQSTSDEKATRESMALMHHNMAEAHAVMEKCLSSNKPLAECQQELRMKYSELRLEFRETGRMGTMGKGHRNQMWDHMMGCPMAK